jgi:hypothetical protein
MRRIPLLILLASVAFTLAQAKPKKQQAPSALFREARYVYVECPDGGPLTPGLLPEDLQAIWDVETGIHNWNRYVVTPRRDQAELIFVVRKGRVVTASGHVGVSLGNHSPDKGVGPGDTTQQPNNAGGGVEVGPPDDLLWVYTRNPDGTLSGPIWMKSEPEGLRSRNVPLLEEVRNEVDAAYPLK